MLSRQILRRLSLLTVPKFSNVCGIHNRPNQSEYLTDDLEEIRKKQLWLRFKTRDITEKDVFELSPDIQSVNLKIRDKGTFAYVDFESEDVAMDNLTKLQEAGIWSNYCGRKRRLYRPNPDPDLGNTSKKPYIDPNATKKLRLNFRTSVTEEEVRQLSPEHIRNVKVQNYEDDRCKVIVTFATEEKAIEHYYLFQIISIREWPAKVARCGSGPISKPRPSTELIFKDLHDNEGEDELLEQFPDATNVYVFYSLYNQRWAKVRFPDAEACMKAFNKSSSERIVSVYHLVTNTQGVDKKKVNKKQLRMRLKPWHTMDTLKTTFRRAKKFRFYHRVQVEQSILNKFVFIDFENEEDCHRAFNVNRQYDIQYGFENEEDKKTLVLNDISEWDNEESLKQLYPETYKIYIHRTVSDNRELTIRNAFLMFHLEEDCLATLEANDFGKRNLSYRVIS